MTTVRTTHRWRGVIAIVLLAGAVGVLLRRPSVLFLSAIGAVFAAYPHLPESPSVSLDIERSTTEETPEHGDTVEVTVSVTNTGEETLADVRIIDGVPPMLEVTDGTPRHTSTLRPGSTTTFSYEVRAKQGTHWFEPATVIVRDLSGASEVETTIDTETAIECLRDVPETPLRSQTAEHVGPIVTDDGGAGIEFHGAREYQHGDEMNRIDWNRFARSGELTTIEFREERLTTVVVCLDAREAAYRSEDDDEPHAVSYGLAAAEQLISSVSSTPNRVGLAGIGRTFSWFAPGTGIEHEQRARQFLATDRTLSAHQPGEPTEDDDVQSQVTELRKRLDADSQVLFVSPLPDETSAEVAMTLEAGGHSVTVVTPDVTADETVGSRLARVERRQRISTLRESGVRVVEWSPSEPLGTTLLRAKERWVA